MFPGSQKTGWNKSLNGLQVQYHSEAQKEVGKKGNLIGIPHIAYVLQLLAYVKYEVSIRLNGLTLASSLESDSVEWNRSNDTVSEGPNGCGVHWPIPKSTSQRLNGCGLSFNDVIIWTHVMYIITLMYMMYTMMHMYLYNIIYTILEYNRNIWNGMNMEYRFRTSSVSCQGKGSHKDCCSAGPTWVLCGFETWIYAMIVGLNNKDDIFFVFFCISRNDIKPMLPLMTLSFVLNSSREFAVTLWLARNKKLQRREVGVASFLLG